MSLIQHQASCNLLQRDKPTLSVQDSRCYHALRVEGSTRSNQSSTQPQRYKEGGQC